MTVDDKDQIDVGELQTLWQSDDPQPVDLSKVARRARWLGYRIRMFVVLETLFCLCGIGFYFWFGLQSDRLAEQVMGVATALGLTYYIYLALKLRLGTYGDGSETGLALIDLQLHRARRAMRYIQINIKGGYLFLPFIGLAVWVVYQRTDGTLSGNALAAYGAFAFTALFMLSFPLMVRPYVRRKSAEVERLTAIRRELERED